MASKTDIANIALAKFREGRITDIESPTDSVAIVMADQYDHALELLLEEHRWNFAGKRVTLSQLAAEPAFGWDHQYQLPSDCIRLKDVNGEDTEASSNSFTLEGRMLLTNDDTVTITYVAKITDTSLFSPSFVEALSFKLASITCGRLTGEVELAIMLGKQYEVALSKAIHNDTKADGSREHNLMARMMGSSAILGGNYNYPGRTSTSSTSSSDTSVAAHKHELSDLLESSAANGQVIAWNATTEEWEPTTFAGGGDMLAANNLSEVTPATARTNLELGTAATTAASAYATASHTHVEADISNLGTTIVLDSDIGSTVQAHSAVLDATTASFTTADETKLDGIVSVKDFGAVGDGVADDTVAIQAALDSGATSVLIPSGVFLCGTLTMPNIKNFVLRGYNTSSRLKMKSGGKLITWAGDGGSIYYQQGTISDIYIDGTNGTDHCIDTTGVGGMDLLNVYILNVPVNYNAIHVDGYVGERTHDINIRGFRCYSPLNAGNAGIGFGPNSSDCNVEEFIMNGNYLVDYCLDFESGATGIYVNGGHPYNAAVNVVRIVNSTSLYFTGVGIDSAKDNSVSISGGSHYTFVNCFFQNIESAKVGLNIFNSAQSVNVIGGRFQGVGATSAVVADNTTTGVHITRTDAAGESWTIDFDLAGASSTVLNTRMLGRDGFVNAPFYSFNEDSDTGIWRPSADSLEFVTNGQQRMLLTDDARIKLGAGVKIEMGNGLQIISGNGTPELNVTAPKGSIYTRTDGAAGTAFYVKESGTGNTGWKSTDVVGEDVQAHSAVLDATTASFLTADETKLDNIEELADVTDETNVVAALDGATITTATVDGADKVLVQDADDTDNLKTVTAQSIANLGGGGSGMVTGISKNSGANVNAANRSVLNFIEGTNVTLTIADDAGGDEVDITIASSGGGASALADLSDVVSATNTNEFVLVANGTTGYVGRALLEADISNLQAYITDITGEPLSDLSDVTITAIATGEVLTWSGTAWINETLAEAGISEVGHPHTASEVTDFSTAADARIGAAVLDDLNDVTETTITSGDVLRWNGSAWVNHAESNYATGAEGDLASTALQAAAIGTTVQAFDAGLVDIAALAVTDGNIIVGDGANWVAESGATARTSLGLGSLAEQSTVTLTTDVTGDLPFANLVPATAASRLVGRGSASGAGDMEEITLGAGLTMSGTELSSSGGSGDITTDDAWVANGDLIVGTGTNTAGILTLGSTDQVLKSNGTTAVWGTIAGSGTVTTSGTPVALDFAKFTDATTIEGRSYTEVKTDLGLGTTDNPQFATVELGAATDTTLSRSAAGVLAVEGNDVLTDATTVFDHLFIPAGAAIPRTTNGAEAGTPTELATNDIMLENLAFDTATEEGVGFWITLPLGWDAGTVKIKPYWTAASGTGTVKWDFAARAYADSDAIDQALGTEQGSTDTLLTANDMHIGPTTSALTIGGTPADGEPFYLQVARDTLTDTLDVDALLIGFSIEYSRTVQTATGL